MAFVELIPIAQCRIGTGTFVEHGDRALAVFRLANPERVVVIDNACPHAGGSLSGGEVTGSILTCPWHYWQFDLNTGRCTHSDLARVRQYSAQVRDGVVWADLPD